MQPATIEKPPVAPDESRAPLLLHSTPSLPLRMLAPAGLRWGTLKLNDNAALRWCHLAAEAPRSDCLLAVGFCEFIEKYFELFSDLAHRGINVWCFDWRGQGLSDRHGARPELPTARDFDRDIKDLIAMTAVMGPKTRPRIFMAHSMGAAIGLRALSDGHAHFDAAVLSGPMLSVATGALPVWLARIVTASAIKMGGSDSLIPGVRFWNADGSPRPNPATSDPVRGALMHHWFQANPLLKIDGITFAWYQSALTFCDTLRDLRRFEAIPCPVLFGVAGQDVFVNTAPLGRLANVIKDCRIAQFETARHELFHEADSIRTAWLQNIDDFLSHTFKGA